MRRVYEVAKVELLPFVDALPTRDNPKVDLGVEIRGTLIPAGRVLPKRARLHAVDPEAEPLLEGGGALKSVGVVSLVVAAPVSSASSATIKRGVEKNAANYPCPRSEVMTAWASPPGARRLLCPA